MMKIVIHFRMIGGGREFNELVIRRGLMTE
jgi:hypothetical protein